ncbi:hypothetical protein ABG984_05850 [Collinsella aerofaciens]|jgi:hypothetical protein|uniref:hypothetical protein n=1 Tax=Collinsella aerofaciens TaxID=74426 RepID=UPI00325A5B0A
MTTMKPCPKCHSTEHLHIEVNDDRLNGSLSAKVACTECHIEATREYVTTGLWAEERWPCNWRLTQEAIREWNEQCDDWEGMFDRE